MLERSIPILMYHRITEDDLHAYSEYEDELDRLIVTPKAFAAQMEWLNRSGFKSISLDHLIDARENCRSLDRRSVVITFDDGYQDVVDFAVPVLRKYGFTAHFFLVANLVGHMSDWDRDHYGWSFPLFSWETARELESLGFHCDAHSMTHSKLDSLDQDCCRREINECKYVLKQELDRDILHFAYPYGSYNAEVKCIVREAGFRSACSVRPGLSPASDNPYALRRVNVHLSDSLVDFRIAIFSGRNVRMSLKRRLNKWLKMVRSGR